MSNCTDRKCCCCYHEYHFYYVAIMSALYIAKHPPKELRGNAILQLLPCMYVATWLVFPKSDH